MLCESTAMKASDMGLRKRLLQHAATQSGRSLRSEPSRHRWHIVAPASDETENALGA